MQIYRKIRKNTNHATSDLIMISKINVPISFLNIRIHHDVLTKVWLAPKYNSSTNHLHPISLSSCIIPTLFLSQFSYRINFGAIFIYSTIEYKLLTVKNGICRQLKYKYNYALFSIYIHLCPTYQNILWYYLAIFNITS